jgi:hypothetical protein
MRSAAFSVACSLLLATSSAFSNLPIKASSPPASVLPPSKDPWYTAPNGFQNAQPGAILRLRAAPGNLTGLTKNSTAAYNILYRTTNSRYQPTWGVTTLFVPTSPCKTSNSSAGNALLSYQIAYDSVDVDASPSYAMYAAPESDVEKALGMGWYVNVPDYEGPLASFTAGVQSGHATLDSVRAVLNAGFGLSPSARYAMWGYSGGALASEWAAELQVQYAPEMTFAGAALGGLTPNITSVLQAIAGGPLAGLAPSGTLGLASQWPELALFIKQNLKTTGPYNATSFYAVLNDTLIESIGAFANSNLTDYFKHGEADLLQPIPQRATNSDGIMGYHGIPQMPVYAYKAIKDEVSPVADTDKLIERFCGVGANINYERNTVGGHSSESTNGNAAAFAFLSSVLKGTYTHTGCTIKNVTITLSTGTL